MLSRSFGQIWRLGITYCQSENSNASVLVFSLAVRNSKSSDLAKRSRQHLYFVCFLIHKTPNIHQEISTDKRRKRNVCQKQTDLRHLKKSLTIHIRKQQKLSAKSVQSHRTRRLFHVDKWNNTTLYKTKLKIPWSRPLMWDRSQF